MSWFDQDLNLGPLAPLLSMLPLDQWAKENSLKKTCVQKNVLEIYDDKFI